MDRVRSRDLSVNPLFFPLLLSSVKKQELNIVKIDRFESTVFAFEISIREICSELHQIDQTKNQKVQYRFDHRVLPAESDLPNEIKLLKVNFLLNFLPSQ